VPFIAVNVASLARTVEASISANDKSLRALIADLISESCVESALADALVLTVASFANTVEASISVNERSFKSSSVCFVPDIVNPALSVRLLGVYAQTSAGVSKPVITASYIASKPLERVIRSAIEWSK
jgi:hypothetical protein